MNLIQLSIRYPVSTFSGVILVVLFGVLGLSRLPVQLTPDVEAPTISVNTTWLGASPYEIEKELVDRQEEVLKSIPALVKMESASYNSRSEITLTFKVGTELEAALTRVANKLNEVKERPENADKPIIDASGAESSPVIWMMLKSSEQPNSRISYFRTFFEDSVRQRLERVPGVGSLFVIGGAERRLEIQVDPLSMAQYGITINEVIERVRGANSNISAGVLGMDKRNYRVRTVGLFQSPEDADAVLLRDDGLRRIWLRDVAQTDFGYEPNPLPVIHNNDPMIVVGVRKEAGANVLSLTEEMRQVVDELNDDLLAGQGLYFDWVYDQTPYINTALETVQVNLALGAVLAITVLFLFLRSVTSTLTVAIAIPISVVGTFIFMLAFDRNINVVSLAGISFAVGMLVDNAIVVLENIDRHRRMGKDPFHASYDGAREVWGAVLASTVTTVAVFLPVLFVQEEAGQLFRDIAIAITFSILLSLFVSVSVIPAVTNKFYSLAGRKPGKVRESGRGNFIVRGIMALSSLTLRNVFTRLLTVAAASTAAVLVTIALLPKAEYLPQGNRNLIMNILIPPPGYSEDKRQEMGQYVMDRLMPYVEEDGKDGIPQIDNLFYVSSDRISLFGGTSEHVTRAREMMPLFNQVMNEIPGVFGISLQRGIFESGIGQGRSVDVDVLGEDYEKIVAVARTLYGKLQQSIPDSQIRPVPSLEIGYPEANLIPNRSAVIANGLSEQGLGVYVDVLMDGRKIGEYKPDGGTVLDLVVTGGDTRSMTPEDLLNAQIANGFGQLIRVGDVAELQYDQGMTQINRLERKRNVRLELTPPEDYPLQQAMETINEQIVPELQQAGLLNGVEVKVGGKADKLDVTREALQWNFILAIVITYLLMSALFSNYLYPLVILITVPLAAAGGFIGLWAVNTYIAPQPFDILVMLGFIILVGTVVNNAILIVHQALNNIRDAAMSGMDAITASVRTRIRPIFMSTTTSLFGLLPLVLATGSGSELYRGLGSVILGGLAVSTVFTLFVIPALLSFLLAGRKAGAAA